MAASGTVTVAVVHETLSQSFDESVDFDDVADRLRAMVVEVTSSAVPGDGTSGEPVTSRRQGSFGRLRAELATSLSMVLVELLQNAVEHGFAGGPGCVRLVVRRSAEALQVSVEDDGRGLPADFDPTGEGSLGLAIVRTLVESELGGRITFGPAPEGGPGHGTTATVTVPLAATPGFRR